MIVRTLRFKPLFIISFYFIALLFITFPTHAQTVPESDSLALVALYHSTNGENWTRNDNWLEGPVRSWYGITIWDLGGISEINLSGNNLVGSLPEEIGNLTKLGYLYLGNNHIFGKIPTSIENLTNLRVLSLNSNELTGEIPIEIKNLNSLTVLTLDQNKLTGQIPKEIGNLVNLKTISISSNQIEGRIPIEIGYLNNLSFIYLQDNNINGPIPSSLGNLILLNSLLLQKNQLSGQIPVEIMQLSALEWLMLNDNNLEGTIPAKIENLTKLKYLYLSNNQFHGDLPNGLNKLTEIELIDIGNNKFSGLPDLSQIFTSRPEILKTFNVNDNYFSFEDIIPNLDIGNPFYYRRQKNFGKADTIYVKQNKNYVIELGIDPGVSNNLYSWFKDSQELTSTNINKLSLENITVDDIGVYFCKVTNPQAPDLILYSKPVTLKMILPEGRTVPESDSLVLVSLYNSTNGENWTRKDNWLKGRIDTWYGISVKDAHVNTINLPKNQLTGEIPSDIGDLSNLAVLSLYSNNLSGEVPAEIGNLQKLYILYLQDNHIEGEIPKAIGKLKNLGQLHFGNNNLTGKIPHELGDLPYLKRLIIYQNQLEGSIPKELCNLKFLEELKLYSNKLSGSIPPEIGNLSNLKSLWLADNRMSGSVPTAIGDLSNLTALFLFRNELSEIPPEIGNLSNLVELYIDDNQLENLPKEISKLDKLKNLSLSNNRLNGFIPEEIFRLSNLTYLKLNGNSIKGDFPLELTELSNLSVLDLSDNQLSGTIPSEIGNLSNLSILNLSKNNMSGSIPSEIGRLTRLTTLWLSDNQFSGSIPEQIGQLTSLSYLILSNNKLNHLSSEINKLPSLINLYLHGNLFADLPDLKNSKDLLVLTIAENQLTFEDIIPIQVSDSAFLTKLIPQDSIGQTETIHLQAGESYTIHLGIDSAITTNAYRWFKDSVEIAVTHQNSFTITDVAPEDAGVYTCEVTNPAVDSLTLYSRPVTLIIQTEPVFQTIAFDTIPDKAYGDEPFLLSVTSDAGLEVFFEVVSGPVHLSGDTLTITGAGDVTVKAFNEGNDTYLPVETERSFTVAKASQTIAFDLIPDKILGDIPFSLTASASSGLPVSFIVEGPALLEGNVLTLTDTGKVIITAKQPGNENYLPAEEVIRSFVIKAATFTLSGKVKIEAGDPASSGAVILYTPNETGRLTTFKTRVLGSDGAYAFTSLKAGDYSVGVIPDDPAFLTTYLGDVVIRSEASLVSLKQDTENSPITLLAKTQASSGNVTISGVLILEESSSGGRILAGAEEITGTPLPEVAVFLMDASGNVIATEVTDAAGKFSFENIPAGSYAFKADYEGMPHDADNFTIEISDKDVAVTALVAKEGIVRLQEVSVVTGTGDEIAKASVLLYPNPTEGKFTILLDAYWMGGSMNIHHVSGQQVANKKINDTRLPVDLRHVQAGLYVITLQKGEYWQVMRVSKF